jgi:hypothetical protein
MAKSLRVELVSYGCRLPMPGNPYPMYPHVERLNCVSIYSASGQRYVFNHGPTRVCASIFWKAIGYKTAKKYEDFLLGHAKMGQAAFGIQCPEYIDFGLGMGADIVFAQYAGPPTTKDIIIPRDDAGLFYDIELPYMFVKEN